MTPNRRKKGNIYQVMMRWAHDEHINTIICLEHPIIYTCSWIDQFFSSSSLCVCVCDMAWNEYKKHIRLTEKTENFRESQEKLLIDVEHTFLWAYSIQFRSEHNQMNHFLHCVCFFDAVFEAPIALMRHSYYDYLVTFPKTCVFGSDRRRIGRF